MDENEKTKREICFLSRANGIEAWCTREKCIFWRLLEAQEALPNNAVGCGLQHYDIINNIEEDKVKWLLEMKHRLENISPEDGRARVNFRHRKRE